MNIRLITVLIIISIGFISGCSLTALSDEQILGKANQYAATRGINLKDYDVSLASSDSGGGSAMSLTGTAHPDFSRNVKGKAGHDARAVLFTPKNRRHDPAYTFYINKNTGKLTMVTKHK